MKLEYVPLLQVQRDLYKMPRGFERFREYIKTMRGCWDSMRTAWQPEPQPTPNRRFVLCTPHPAPHQAPRTTHPAPSRPHSRSASW